MFFNSRAVASILSTVLVVFSFVVLQTTIHPERWDLFIILLTEFLLMFGICFLSFELLFFKEFRKIYKVFEMFQLDTNQTPSRKKTGKKMSSDLLIFAKSKQQEIQKLKQLETFRKEFLADISHELKTPIFSAQGFIHTLLDGAIDDPKVSGRFLKKAAKSLDQLDNLIQDLIVISQLETGKIKIEPEQFSLNELILEIFELLEPKRALRDTTFQLRTEGQQYDVFADKNRISQVLKNLIDNAVKYGKDNGKVTLYLTQENERIKIKIQDDGLGIPEEHLDKIFRRFYRVEKSRSKEMGGTGLGLSIVKHIIEAHNSNIAVSSTISTGTVFTFDLQKG